MLISQIGPAVEAFTQTPAPAYDRDVLSGMSGRDALFAPDRFPSGPHYQYMAYLRHHGFPSPLLDWSRSPFIAAFFALRHASPEDGNRSIYGYCETLSGVKGGAVGERAIRTIGPYVRTHPRHFLQQSAYTVCESLNIHGNGYYDSHQATFEGVRPEQDFLWRFDFGIPRPASGVKRRPAASKQIRVAQFFSDTLVSCHPIPHGPR